MIRYIFSVSTGRAGSHYLSEIFRHVDGCVSEHEPAPKLNAAPMRAFLAGDRAPMAALMPSKIASIQERLGSQRLYVETNHCFIKGFGWFIPDYLPHDEIGVIALHRPADKIKSSMNRVLCTPFLPAGDQWMITPEATPHHVPLPPEFSFPMARFHLYRWLSRTVARPGIVRRVTRGRMNVPPAIRRYQDALVEWYIAETDARWQEYKRTFPRIRTIDVELDELNSLDGIRRLLATFDLEPNATIESVLGHATNTKSDKRAHG